MDRHDIYFITWTTYGTWLPGDARGWRSRQTGNAIPQPLLERWCREKMNGDVVLLAEHDRHTVELACQEHCRYRDWPLLAVNARSNHVHIVVGAAQNPQNVRDQLKANATRCLRRQEKPLNASRTWSRGGDCEIVQQDNLEAVLIYVNEAQGRKVHDIE